MTISAFSKRNDYFPLSEHYSDSNSFSLKSRELWLLIIINGISDGQSTFGNVSVKQRVLNCSGPPYLYQNVHINEDNIYINYSQIVLKEEL